MGRIVQLVACMKSVKMKKRQSDSLTDVCKVCHSPAPSYCHYGAITCFPCRAFFRRGIQHEYQCSSGDFQCEIKTTNRSDCKACRFHRCLAVGMKPELVDKRVKRWKKEKSIINLKEEKLSNHAENDTGKSLKHACQDGKRIQTDSQAKPNALDVSNDQERKANHRISVIKKNVTNECAEQNFSKQIDIDKIVDACFLEETINEKEEQSDSGLNQGLEMNFTDEEESMLCSMIAKRDHLDEKKLKYMLDRNPNVVNAIWMQMAVSLRNGRKIHHNEDYETFYYQSLLDVGFKDVIDAFGCVNTNLIEMNILSSLAATSCLLFAALEGTKLLGLKQQSHFIGYRGREYDKLWNLHFPDLEGFEGITKENFFNFT